MTKRSKKIGFWLGITSAFALSAALTATFVIFQQKNKKNEALIKKNRENIKRKKDTKPPKTDSLVKKESEFIEKDEPINALELNTKKELDWKEVFPVIKSSDYYEKLNYKDGQAWIDENMILYIIKDVINRMLVVDGVLEYAYKQIDDQNLILTFKWNNDKEKSVVSYKFGVNKL